MSDKSRNKFVKSCNYSVYFIVFKFMIENASLQ